MSEAEIAAANAKSAADAAVAKAAADAASKEGAAKAAAEAAAAKANADPDLVRMTPRDFKARQDEARTAGEKKAAEQFAAELGIPLADAKKLIADAKAKDDAQKSEVQKLTEQLAAERLRIAELEPYKAIGSSRADAEFAALSDVQKAAVESLAGKDPAKRLSTIDALRPTWAAALQSATEAAATKAASDAAAKAVADAKAAEEAKAKAKVPAGAQTTTLAVPPPAAAPGQATNHLAVWEDMRVKNPAVAARYRLMHNAAILAAQRQQTTG